MAERTPFEAEVERTIVDETERMLGLVDDVARRHNADETTVRAAVLRFGGGDLVDCWDEYVA